MGGRGLGLAPRRRTAVIVSTLSPSGSQPSATGDGSGRARAEVRRLALRTPSRNGGSAVLTRLSRRSHPADLPMRSGSRCCNENDADEPATPATESKMRWSCARIGATSWYPGVPDTASTPTPWGSAEGGRRLSSQRWSAVGRWSAAARHHPVNGGGRVRRARDHEQGHTGQSYPRHRAVHRNYPTR